MESRKNMIDWIAAYLIVNDSVTYLQVQAGWGACKESSFTGRIADLRTLYGWKIDIEKHADGNHRYVLVAYPSLFVRPAKEAVAY